MGARDVVAIASGKGGVGKSTVSVNVALALAELGHRVGLLDADLYGPDVPRMFGLTRRAKAASLPVWTSPGRNRPQPVERHGVKIMSTQFLVGEDQPVAFSTPLAQLFLRQVLAFDWGELDYLVVDLPPGTADLQQEFAHELRLSGVVMVVTPQDVAHLDARKAIAMYRAAKVPIIGGVENMAGMTCPHCDGTIDVFGTTTPDRAIWADGIAKLASLPLVPALAAQAEAGVPVLLADPEGAVSAGLRAVARAVVASLDPAARPSRTRE